MTEFNHGLYREHEYLWEVTFQNRSLESRVYIQLNDFAEETHSRYDILTEKGKIFGFRDLDSARQEVNRILTNTGLRAFKLGGLD